MKGLLKVFGKFVMWMFSIAVCLTIIVGGVLTFQGYRMYKEAVDVCSIEERAEDIRQRDGFTKFEDLPQFYVDAVISAEDQRFYSHPGLDPLAIARAAYHDLKAMSMVEGGSTITQQLAKNLLFDQEKRLERKFAEIFAAFALEKKYSKNEIFELYVNSIYFGNGKYGIHDAAEEYFGKEPSQLSNYECALLAGIPNAPSAYALDKHPDLAKKRAQQVLERMEMCDKVTADDLHQLSGMLATAQG